MKITNLILALLFLLFLMWATNALADGERRPEQLITEKLTAEVPASLGVVAVSLSSNVKALEEPLSFHWKTPPKEGFSDVQIKYTAKKKQYTTWARVELRPMQQVLVATRELHTAEEIAAGDLALELRPVRAGEALSIDPALFLGNAVLDDLVAGEVVTAADVQLPKLVARGTKLKVIVQSGGLQVTTSGTLEQQARVGEDSSARLSDGKLVQGKLSRESTLLVGVK